MKTSLSHILGKFSFISDHRLRVPPNPDAVLVPVDPPAEAPPDEAPPPPPQDDEGFPPVHVLPP